MKNGVLMRSIINTLYFRQNNSLILKLTSGQRNSYLYSKAAKSYFDEPREKLPSRPRPRQDNLEVVKAFRSQGVHNILCATRKFVIIK
jgi:hypothetical protein